MRRLFFGVPVVTLVVLGLFAFTPCIATCGEADEVVTATVRACPRAVALLGADPSPARLGWACGRTDNEGAYGRSSWSLPYKGERARGTVTYAAERRGGGWQLDQASLEVDGETIDLLACTRRARTPPPPPPAAQTNADARTATLDGKVLRSTHASIPAGAPCHGTLTRERGSPFAHVTVACGAGPDAAAATAAAAAGERTTLYDGTGRFTLDVRDPARPDDDHLEVDDAATSEADHTPGCRASLAGATGTLTVWDSTPAYEVVIAL